MTPGQIVRRILGPAFQPVGEAYRRVFVDMRRVVAAMAEHLPQNARVLDVGGGDGYVVELLLNRRPDLRVTMTDLAPQIGSFLSPENRERVALHPATPVAEMQGSFDAITMADVIHHVPREVRPGFLAEVAATAVRTGAPRILVKDIQPGNPRAWLSLASDLYITGDKGVSLVAQDAVAFPGFRRTAAAMPDYPNYLLAFAPEA